MGGLSQGDQYSLVMLGFLGFCKLLSCLGLMMSLEATLCNEQAQKLLQVYRPRQKQHKLAGSQRRWLWHMCEASYQDWFMLGSSLADSQTCVSDLTAIAGRLSGW